MCQILTAVLKYTSSQVWCYHLQFFQEFKLLLLSHRNAPHWEMCRSNKTYRLWFLSVIASEKQDDVTKYAKTTHLYQLLKRAFIFVAAPYRWAFREPCLNMRSGDFWRSRTYWTRDLTCVDSSAPRELEGTEKLHYVGRQNRYRVFMWLLCRRCRNFGIPLWLRMIRWWTTNWEGFGKSQSWLSHSICLGGLRRTKQQFRIMWLTPKRR